MSFAESERKGEAENRGESVGVKEPIEDDGLADVYFGKDWVL